MNKVEPFGLLIWAFVGAFLWLSKPEYSVHDKALLRGEL